MWPQLILKETKDMTRIYVFVGKRKNLVRFMKQMNVEQLFSEGKYMVIFISPETTIYDERAFFLWNKEDSLSSTGSSGDSQKTCETMGPEALDQWRSLIVVSGSPYRVDTSDFANKVRLYNELEPFNFTNSFNVVKEKKFEIHISIYAAHLYDSAILYAKALQKVIDEQKALGKAVDIAALARDGRAITEAIKNMGGYDSISGNFIRIDDKGDSEGNFTAFALKEHNYTYVSRFTGQVKFTCNYYPIKVGEFYSTPSGSNGTNKITYSPKENIDWPRNHKPVDEPHCGYDGSKCPRSKGRAATVAIILGVTLFLFIFVAFTVYRKWKIEEEIAGLLWKIHPNSLQVRERETKIVVTLSKAEAFVPSSRVSVT